MRKWKLEELEAHVKLLADAGQPIPQSLNLLLADARKKEERRINKRASNRRSASTSRARKKALVEEMTRLNAKLRRQALILSLLPDMVLAIDVDGVITFCSAQAERILQHNSEDLVGAKLSQLLVPPSRDALSRLVDELVATQSKAAANAANAVGDGGDDDADNAEGDNAPNKDGAEGGRQGRRGQKNVRGEDGAVVVSEQSEQSFPLSVVNVKNRSKQAAANNEDVSDSSGGETTAGACADAAENDSNGKDKGRSNDSKGDGTTSSLTNNSSLSRSTTNSSFGNDSKDAADEGGDGSKSERESVSTDRAVKSDHRHSSNSGRKESKKDKEGASTPPSAQSQQQQQPQQAQQQQQPPQHQTSSGDDSSSSSNRLAKASEALNRNVRWHNENMMTSGKVGETQGVGLTDDVTGASVTANNAGARLSSLQHLPSMIADASNNAKKAEANNVEEAMPQAEEGSDRIKIKKVTGKTKKSTVDRTSSTLTFDESLEDAQSSSSSDSLLSGVEDKERRGKRDMSSEDSGYRESGESVPSREDSSTASDDASSEDKDGSSRPKPLAPTCNICVIRKDLSTVWCEVTSSIRTRNTEDDESGEALSSLTGSGNKTSSSESGSADEQQQDNKPSSTHELLLCFRPIRDGEERVGEELRFVPPEKMEIDEDDQEQASADRSSNTAAGSGSTEAVSSLTQSADRSNSNSNNSASTEDATNTSGSSEDKKPKAATRGPPKKRPLEGAKVSASSSAGANSAAATSSGDGCSKEPAQKKRRSLSPSNAEEAEIAESLVLMNKSPQKSPQ
jgi:hypothetical protein